MEIKYSREHYLLPSMLLWILPESGNLDGKYCKCITWFNFDTLSENHCRAEKLYFPKQGRKTNNCNSALQFFSHFFLK